MENRVGIGKQNHFRSAPYIVTWIDLLGYGSMLKKCGFDPTSESAEKAVKRLEEFNLISLKYSNLNFPLLQMNDGIATWRELSFRTKSVTQDFLGRSIEFFYAVTEREKEQGYPGPRMVISTGIRMKMDNLHKIIAKERAERLISKITDGQIKVEEAIYQACNYTDYCNGVNALQANFAFTKSFLAEESGTKGGLPGNNIYIDMSVFNKENLKCLNIAEPFIWKECPGLETVFAKVNAYSRKIFMKYSEGEIASTLEISKHILKCTKENEVITRLKT